MALRNSGRRTETPTQRTQEDELPLALAETALLSRVFTKAPRWL